MKTNAESTEELKEEIKRLNIRIDVLSHDLNRLAKSNFESNEIIRKHLGLIDRDQENASSRIKNLELKTFPDLAKDIVRLHDIIGDGEDKSDNPLDHRKK